MSIYTNNNTFPISLFNVHDDKQYESFMSIQMDFKKGFPIGNYISYLAKVFKEEKNQHLIAKLLVIFPFIFFSNAEEIKQLNSKYYNIKENEFSVYNPIRFLRVLNLRLNHTAIRNSIRDIVDSNNAEINYSNFITQIFIVLYKYAFIEISESIYWSTGGEIKQGMTFKELFAKEGIAKNIINNKNSHEFMVNGANAFIKNLNGSISIDDNIVLKTKDQINFFLKPSYFSKVLYSIIDFNIKWVDNFSSTKKNKLLRPLFHEIVCKICYPKIYDEGIDSIALKQKYRNFLKSY